MSLGILRIDRLRNLENVEIVFQSQCSIFHGLNGSGKTSLLEAVYLLGRGNSFRSKNLDNLVNYGKSDFICFAQLSNAADDKVGFSRNGDSHTTLIKKNGEAVRSLSELASTLPVLLITPQTFDLLTGGPKERRRFLDWGVFHVEHEYKRVWQQWRRVLNQRNKILKNATINRFELSSWDNQFSELSEKVSAYRKHYSDVLIDTFRSLLECSDFTKNGNAETIGILRQIEFHYEKGWKLKTGLEEQLANCYETDYRYGYSTIGPQKAELQFKFSEKPVTEVLSRGQLKALITTLLVAQLTILKKKTDQQCTVLIDDIGAELDMGSQVFLLKEILKNKAQALVTVLDADNARNLASTVNEDFEVQMFHVEHGQITPANERG